MIVSKISRVSQIKQVKNIHSIRNEVPTTHETASNDSFEKNEPTFKGRNLTALKNEFKTHIVADVKKNLNKSLEIWKNEVYEIEYKYLKDNRPDHRVNIHGQSGTYNTNNIMDRIMVGTLTLGLTELDRAAENAGFRKDARAYADKMVVLRSELENIKFNEELAIINKSTKANSDEIKYNASIQKIKDDVIRPNLLDKVQRFREGRPVKIPNCIMFSNPDNNLNKELIKWISKQTSGNFLELDSNENIIQKLEALEEAYQKSGDWNLLYAPMWDENINTYTSDKRTIAAYKDIMSNCASDYHTTIIFETQKADKLDTIALQPHRVTKINMDDLKSIEQLSIDAAKERLAGNEYLDKTPIAALNDLLLISGNKDIEVKWNYTEKDFSKVETLLNEFIVKENNNYKDQVTHVLDVLRYVW